MFKFVSFLKISYRKSSAKKRKSMDPEPELSYDNCSHWVKFDKKHSRSRCKMSGCKNFTHAFCTKCEIHLCCSVNHNCFLAYHVPASAKAQVKPPRTVKVMHPVKQPKRNSPKKTTTVSSSEGTPKIAKPIRKKVHWKRNLCQVYEYLSETAVEEDDNVPKIRVAEWAKIQYCEEDVSQKHNRPKPNVE